MKSEALSAMSRGSHDELAGKTEADVVGGVTGLYGLVRSLEARFDERSNAVEQRFTAVEQRLTVVEQRLTVLDGRLEKVSDNVAELGKLVFQQSGRIDALGVRMDGLERDGRSTRWLIRAAFTGLALMQGAVAWLAVLRT